MSAAVCAFVLAAPLAGQSVVRSARVTTDLSADDGRADVHIRYVILASESTEVRFQLLGFGDATAREFRLGESGVGELVELAAESGSLRAATVVVPSSPAGEVVVDVYYLIERAVKRTGPKVRVHVPLLVLMLPPEPGVAGVFQASVRLPETWAVSEGFPTGLQQGDDGLYDVGLAVVPSSIGVRARSDGSRRPGVPLILDVLALLIMFGFGIRGWKHFREAVA